MARYTNNSTSNETTTEDRIQYANKWVDNYLKVKTLMSEAKLKTRGEVVKHLVDSWEAKASESKDTEVL